MLPLVGEYCWHMSPTFPLRNGPLLLTDGCHQQRPSFYPRFSGRILLINVLRSRINNLHIQHMSLDTLRYRKVLSRVRWSNACCHLHARNQYRITIEGRRSG